MTAAERSRPADLPLDELRLALAPAIARAAAFDGWSLAALEAAADEASVDHDLARLAFNEAGRLSAMAMIAAWIDCVDAEMARRVPADSLAGLPVRERIRRLVWARLEAQAGLEEAIRRAHAIMAMPANLARAARLGWHGADAMWRQAGDASVDFNHYSKRATLAAIYAAGLAVWVDDASADKAETRAFVDRRIDGVIRFEKAKAQWRRPELERFSMARLLGRLRYPANG